MGLPWSPARLSGETLTRNLDGKPTTAQVWVSWARNGTLSAWREWVMKGHSLVMVVGAPDDLAQDLEGVRSFLEGTGMQLLPGIVWPRNGGPGRPLTLRVGAELALSGQVTFACRPGRLGGRSPARMLAATADASWTVLGDSLRVHPDMTWVAGAGPLGAGKVTVLVDSGPVDGRDGQWDTALLDALVRY